MECISAVTRGAISDSEERWARAICDLLPKKLNCPLRLICFRDSSTTHECSSREAFHDDPLADFRDRDDHRRDIFHRRRILACIVVALGRCHCPPSSFAISSVPLIFPCALIVSDAIVGSFFNDILASVVVCVAVLSLNVGMPAVLHRPFVFFAFAFAFSFVSSIFSLVALGPSSLDVLLDVTLLTPFVPIACVLIVAASSITPSPSSSASSALSPSSHNRQLQARHPPPPPRRRPPL